MKKIKVAVVGLGFMGKTHLQTWPKVPSAQVVAVVSRDEGKLTGDLSGVSGNLSITGDRLDFSDLEKYRTLDELLRESDVDAVDLCVPTHLHHTMASECLKAGKHVLVEKPMALNDQQCAEMIEEARLNQRVLMAAQVIRYWPDYRMARRLVREGEIGSLRLVNLKRQCGAPLWGDWQAEPDRSGGGVFDLLIHDFDYCLHLLERPQAVVAEGFQDLGSGIDWLVARLDYGKDQAAFIEGGWQPAGFPFSMSFTITGTDGVLAFDSQRHRLKLFKGEKEEIYSFEEEDGFRGELESFAAACQEGKSAVENPPDESALAVRLTLAALESRRGRSWSDSTAGRERSS